MGVGKKKKTRMQAIETRRRNKTGCKRNEEKIRDTLLLRYAWDLSRDLKAQM